MPENNTQDRACGSIMGAFIGDALALGPHWYYNLDELHRDYGEWISNYTDPKPNRYHAGLKAGQLSKWKLLILKTAAPPQKYLLPLHVHFIAIHHVIPHADFE